MELASVRDLKAELLEAREPLAGFTDFPRASIGRVWTGGSQRQARLRGLALGIAMNPDRRGDYRLAVRITDESRRALRPFMDRLTFRARGEIDYRRTGPVSAQNLLRQRHRPLICGCSIGHPLVTAGTLGAFVRRAGLDRKLILSNNHVLAAENTANPNDPILQPGPSDGGSLPGDRIDALVDAVPFRVTGNLVDAAIAAVDDRIARGQNEIAGLGSLTGAVRTETLPGLRVAKIGRTTGLTHGVVTAIEVENVEVAFDRGKRTFDQQIEISGENGAPFSAGGDSGALVVDEGLDAVGLLFAGSESGGPEGTGLTYANDIRRVLSLLGIEFAPQSRARIADADRLEGLMAITMDQARRAKDRAVSIARRDHWPTTGIGIGQKDGSLAVKVNLARDFGSPRPREIEGVPVIYVITGTISAY